MSKKNNNKVYLTAEGLRKVEEEYEYLTTVRRGEVAQMIAEAKAEGDISENAGYDEAKTVQGFLEGRINELKNVLKHVEIIQESNGPTDRVILGSTVVIVEQGADLEESYTLVGSIEADPAKGRISNESPMGSALLGKKVGDIAVVESPSGEIIFEVISIE